MGTLFRLFMYFTLHVYCFIFAQGTYYVTYFGIELNFRLSVYTYIYVYCVFFFVVLVLQTQAARRGTALDAAERYV